jgi:ribosomal protein S18 acetylase RimI-like enzyme
MTDRLFSGTDPEPEPSTSSRQPAAPVIRTYAPRDYDQVSEICLLTGERGGDATGLYVSDELMADIFVRPYVAFEPELAFVLDVGPRVSGYIVAVADSARFVERYRSEWLPVLARKYQHVAPPSTRDEYIRHLGFTPERMLNAELVQHPAHLHIDILPQFQGRGYGKQLVSTLVEALRERGVPGVQLSMDPLNVAARRFYDRVGFRELPSSTPEVPLLGIDID